MDYTGSRIVDSLRVKAENLLNIAGGVGPMTVAMLMHNTVEAASRTVGKVEVVPYFVSATVSTKLTLYCRRSSAQVGRCSFGT